MSAIDTLIDKKINPATGQIEYYILTTASDVFSLLRGVKGVGTIYNAESGVWHVYPSGRAWGLESRIIKALEAG